MVLSSSSAAAAAVPPGKPKLWMEFLLPYFEFVSQENIRKKTVYTMRCKICRSDASLQESGRKITGRGAYEFDRHLSVSNL